MDKVRHWATPEAMLAALTALSAPIEGASDLKDAHRERLRELWSWHLEPAAVSWDHRPVAVALRLPQSVSGTAFVELHFDEGEVVSRTLDLESMPLRGTQTIGGETYVERHVSISKDGLLNGRALPFGYHRLEVTIGSRKLQSHIIAAPTRVYEPPSQKRWGLFAPLYSLHSKRSWGVGDFTDLAAFADYAAEQGANFVSTLPILATFLDEPFNPSPYSPVSRLFWNELYLDPAHGRGATDERPSTEAAALSKTDLVPYREAIVLKRRALEQQAAAFLATPSGRAELDAYLDSRPETRDYARFRAAIERLGPRWQVWPTTQRHGDLTPADYDASVADYHAYVQWRTAAQLHEVSDNARSKGVDVYLDLPIGVHSDGHDAWRYQTLFVNSVTVGAPPDPVTTSGQNWLFPPIHPEAQRRSGYTYLRGYLDHHLSVAKVLRLDHVMGMHRLWWVPPDGDARNGLYVRYPYDELYAVHSLQSHTHKAVIIGEDLGVASLELPRNLDRHRLTRLYVVEISLWGPPDDPLLPIRKHVASSIGTHDLPPFAVWWQDLDIEARKALGVLNPAQAALESQGRGPRRAELVDYLRRKGYLAPDDDSLSAIRDAILALLGRSDAEWLTINLEDLWLATDSQNVPGTDDSQHPNWRRRAAHSLEELPTLSEAAQSLARVRESRQAP